MWKRTSERGGRIGIRPVSYTHLKIVETLNGYIHEEKEYDFAILTEAERKDLSEEDLKLYDEMCIRDRG